LLCHSAFAPSTQVARSSTHLSMLRTTSFHDTHHSPLPAAVPAQGLTLVHCLLHISPAARPLLSLLVCTSLVPSK
jgi:hypothetical protein